MPIPGISTSKDTQLEGDLKDLLCLRLGTVADILGKMSLSVTQQKTALLYVHLTLSPSLRLHSARSLACAGPLTFTAELSLEAGEAAVTLYLAVDHGADPAVDTGVLLGTEVLHVAADALAA